MIKIKVITSEKTETIKAKTGPSLLDILRQNEYYVYAPCAGKGTCGKCTVNVRGEGNVLSCLYYPEKDITVILPGKAEAHILVNQTEFLEDMPFENAHLNHLSAQPYGVAIDIGTSTMVLYFLSMLSGQIEKIASLLNPQSAYGADVISRINYCQENKKGLKQLHHSLIRALNHELDEFGKKKNVNAGDFEKIIIAGNTTMLHLLWSVDPLSIALAPFKPAFTDKQIKSGSSTGLHVNDNAEIISLPCLSAYVGADILAGLAAIKSPYKNYLFIDIGTNGEMALVNDDKIFTCAAAAGPAFEGANISCGMAAVYGAISDFISPQEFQVIGNAQPLGICGSGIVDIIAYLLDKNLIDESGRLEESFVIHQENNIQVTQKDIREIQLAKSAIYSGIKILMKHAGLAYDQIDALYLAGGFGNYINIKSAMKIGLLPYELKDRIYPIGNSSGIGALQYLKSGAFENKIFDVLKKSQYIELSYIYDFNMEFALNTNFTKNDI
ncbi:MAG: DUF4445 domain-containing protein [Calditrichaceae bacterium]|nr:DUF4445 domain-containing protein [Calditrichaceae bacterium]MBN2708068.1 DUF4445 domain-containing protein [Calditrichaceae bacterium]RQV97192.1 MAG: DUF4445 domain-containing protein [Calditrichota bacterium]